MVMQTSFNSYLSAKIIKNRTVTNCCYFYRKHKSSHKVSSSGSKDYRGDKDRDRRRDDDRYKDRHPRDGGRDGRDGGRHGGKMSREELEIQEANELRAKLGMAPLRP